MENKELSIGKGIAIGMLIFSVGLFLASFVISSGLSSRKVSPVCISQGMTAEDCALWLAQFDYMVNN